MHMIIWFLGAGCYECNNVSSIEGASYVYCREYLERGRGGKCLHYASDNKFFKEILRCNYFMRQAYMLLLFLLV